MCIDYSFIHHVYDGMYFGMQLLNPGSRIEIAHMLVCMATAQYTETKKSQDLL